MNFRALFAPRDMTQGTPWKRILEFAVPMLIGNIAQQMYNTVDSIVVGRYVGDNALAAVGSAFPIMNLLMVLFVGISTGAGIMVSQYFGAKDREALSHTVGTCLTLTALSSALAVRVSMISPCFTSHAASVGTPVYRRCLSGLKVSSVPSVGLLIVYWMSPPSVRIVEKI